MSAPNPSAPAPASSSFELKQCDGGAFQQFTALKGFTLAEKWCSFYCPPSANHAVLNTNKPSTDCPLLDVKCQLFQLLVKAEDIKNHNYACDAWYVNLLKIC